MKITSQEEYGLRCLLRLARAGEGDVDRSVAFRERARRHVVEAPPDRIVLEEIARGGARHGAERDGLRHRQASSFWIMSESARRRLAAFTWWPSMRRPFTTTVPRPSRCALSSASITSSAAARSCGLGVNASLQ